MSHVTEEIARDRPRSFVERLGRVEEGRKTIADDVGGICAEAGGSGV